MEADARNPNLYTSLEDLKDNRVKVTAEENIYDEIRQRQRTLQREGIVKKHFLLTMIFSANTAVVFRIIVVFA